MTPADERVAGFEPFGSVAIARERAEAFYNFSENESRDGDLSRSGSAVDLARGQGPCHNVNQPQNSGALKQIPRRL